MKKTLVFLWDVLEYFFMFLLFQIVAIGVLTPIIANNQGLLMALANIISGILTICFFVALKWSPLNVVAMRPAKELLWVSVLSIGLLIPSEWLEEFLNIEMPDEMLQLMENIMKEPLGFIAIAIIAPIAEEIVFRGAILRRCLKMFGNEGRGRWIAIAISALAFALAHGNMAQGVHAFLIGLLLGWLFCRTKSILPGVILHWVNNTVAMLQEIIFNLAPDAKLSDMFGGNSLQMYAAIAVSACIAGWAFINIKNQKDQSINMD